MEIGLLWVNVQNKFPCPERVESSRGDDATPSG